MKYANVTINNQPAVIPVYCACDVEWPENRKPGGYTYCMAGIEIKCNGCSMFYWSYANDRVTFISFSANQAIPKETYEVPSPYAVHCRGRVTGVSCNNHKLLYLTNEQYMEQMRNMNDVWKCPVCGSDAKWNDDNYEDSLE